MATPWGFDSLLFRPMSDNTVARTIHLDKELDEDIGHLAYNLKINRLEVIKRLIEKGLDEGILEQPEEET